MIQKRLLTCLLIDNNFCSVGRLYLINTTRFTKKKMAHAYFERRISLLAGKLATFEQMLLTEYISRVLLAPTSF